jgi:hypothetical protein
LAESWPISFQAYPVVEGIDTIFGKKNDNSKETENLPTEQSRGVSSLVLKNVFV